MWPFFHLIFKMIFTDSLRKNSDFQSVYNDRTQKINFEYCNAYGFSINNEISPKDIYHQTSNYIEKQFVAFLDLLTSNKVSCVLDNYSGVNIQENIASLYELALVKYREECYEYELCNKKTQAEVKEPFFLWTLKKPLALFAKEIR